MNRLPRPLLLGTTVALLAFTFFLLIAAGALRSGPLDALDKDIAQDMIHVSERQPMVRAFMIALTHSGGVEAMTVLAVLGVGWHGGRGQWRVAVGWALIVSCGAFLNQEMKTALNRERPPVEWRDAVVSETNESFPSGHAMGGAIGIGLLGYALVLRNPHRRSKTLTFLGLGVWVLLIGLSRVYLRAHWFSDVLGGFALGLAWLSLGLGVLESWRRRALRLQPQPALVVSAKPADVP
jgi:membrane-associated phospholipid phosphatase